MAALYRQLRHYIGSGVNIKRIRHGFVVTFLLVFQRGKSHKTPFFEFHYPTLFGSFRKVSSYIALYPVIGTGQTALKIHPWCISYIIFVSSTNLTSRARYQLALLAWV